MSAAYITERIADEVVVDGALWRIERAWPSSTPGGDLTVEARAAGIPGVRSGTAAADGTVALAETGHDPRLPALAGLARRGTVVSHRAGRRAVVHLGDGAGYAKVVRPGRAARVLAAHRRAQRSGFDDGFSTADAWADDRQLDLGVVHMSTLPGRTLHDLGADPGTPHDEFVAAWRAWADGWLLLLSSDRPVAHLSVHDARAEAGVVQVWAEHAARMLPARADGIRTAAARVTDALLITQPGDLAPSHRDLHDKQVLHAAGGRAGILDLDTACRAEAALDLGNLRAHIALRAAQGQLSETRAQTARDIVDGVIDEAGVSPARLHAYESATALRLGCLYLYRPAWRRMAQEWLAAQNA